MLSCWGSLGKSFQDVPRILEVGCVPWIAAQVAIRWNSLICSPAASLHLGCWSAPHKGSGSSIWQWLDDWMVSPAVNSMRVSWYDINMTWQLPTRNFVVDVRNTMILHVDTWHLTFRMSVPGGPEGPNGTTDPDCLDWSAPPCSTSMLPPIKRLVARLLVSLRSTTPARAKCWNRSEPSNALSKTDLNETMSWILKTPTSNPSWVSETYLPKIKNEHIVCFGRPRKKTMTLVAGHSIKLRWQGHKIWYRVEFWSANVCKGSQWWDIMAGSRYVKQN